MKNQIRFVFSIFLLNTLSFFAQQTIKEEPISVETFFAEGIKSSDSQGEPNIPKVNSRVQTFGVATSEVGNTTGQLGVSLTGSATYSVPIFSAVGIKDMIPSISLSYNSQSGNGIAGFGWNISGISQISRIPTTLHHDSKIDAVNYNLDDRFSMDGQRLILKSGIYGKAGSEYITEGYTNMKIEAVGIHPKGENFGPKYFIVTYPNGNQVYYGDYLETAKGIDSQSWQVNRIVDAQNNYYDYFYFLDNGISTIDRIEYSKNSTLNINNNNIIKFNYIDRARSEHFTTFGDSFYRTKILKSIEININSLLERKYILDYNLTSNTNYNRLIEVQEFNRDNKALDPIKFVYENTVNRAVVTKTDYAGDSKIYEGIQGDFNGDGKIDYFHINTFYISTSSGNSFTKYQIPASFDLGANKGVVNVKNQNNEFLTRQAILFSSTKINPLNNNQTVLTLKIIGFDDYYKKHELINTKDFIYDGFSREIDETINYNKSSPMSNYIEVGDFNGDNISEINLTLVKEFVSKYYINDPAVDYNSSYPLFMLETSKTSTQSYYYIKLDNDFTQIKVNNPFPDGTVMDFNADGKQDIVTNATKAEGLKEVFSFNETTNSWDKIMQFSVPGFSRISFSNEDGDTGSESDIAVFYGDLNGDGKIDILKPFGKLLVDTYLSCSFWRCTTKYNFSYNSWYIGINDGQKINYKSFNWIDYYQQKDVNKYSSWIQNISVQDFNNYGKSDILMYESSLWRVNNNWDSDQDYTGKTSLFINSGIQSNGVPNFTHIFNDEFRETSEYNWNYKDVKPVIADVNYRNPNQEFILFAKNATRTYAFSQDSSKDVLLKKVVEANTSETTIHYDKLEPNSTYFVSNEVFEYPYVKVRNLSQMNIVQKLTNKNIALGLERQQEYKYQDAIMHSLGLGLIGFKALSKSEWFSPAVNTTKFWTNTVTNPYLRGSVVYENTSTTQSFEKVRTSGSISESTYNYKTINEPSKRFINVVSSKKEENLLKGTFATQNIEYDSFYNPIKITENFNNEGNRIVDAEYFNNISLTGKDYHSGRTKKKTTTVSNPNGTFKTSEEFTYVNNLVSQVKRTANNSTSALIESFTYDQVGNILTKTISETGSSQYPIQPRIEKFEYDSSKRFVIKKIDVEGLTTEMTYDSRNGKILTLKNHLGQISTNKFDSWNRLITETNFLGKSVNTFYIKEQNSSYSVKKVGDDGSQSKVTYDALNREIIESSLEFGGKWINNQTKYDALDRVIATSIPYYDGTSPSLWNTATYDAYHRPVSQTDFKGKVTTFTYNKLTSKTDDGKTWKEQTTDSAGNILISKDRGGTVTYSYFPNGEAKTITYDGYSVDHLIDDWGRKIQLNDPTLGIYKTEFNILGEVQKEINPQGTTTYNYSTLGRLLKKTVVGDATNAVTEYIYNNTTKEIDEVKHNDVLNNRISNIKNLYDSKTRLITQTTETTPDFTYINKFVYDSFGRLTQKGGGTTQVKGKILTNKAINSHYDSFGNLTKLTENGTNKILWELKAENVYGQTTQVEVLNTLKNFVYNGYGIINELNSVQKSLTTNVLFRQNYDFDLKYNLLNSRTRTDIPVNETFKYDDFLRLTEWATNGQKTQANYDQKGKLTNESSIGNYIYKTDNQPYNLKDITLFDVAKNYFNENRIQQAKYNVYNNPVSVNQEVGTTTKTIFAVDFFFNADFQRNKSVYSKTVNSTKTNYLEKYYSADGTTEIYVNLLNNNIKQVQYLNGDGYDASLINVQTNINNVAKNEFYSLHRDYLGSILAIADETSKVVESRHFDAWGNLTKLKINGLDINPSSLGGAGGGMLILDRGYTGHEHLFEVKLVHMNARLYDPVLHRFLGPDKYIQDSSNTQNFNRFGYAWNNPLMYTDPSGNFIFSALAIVTGQWWALPYTIAMDLAMVSYTVNSMITGQTWSFGGMMKAAGMALAQSIIFGPGNWVDALVNGSVGIVSNFVKPVTIGDVSITFAPTITTGQGFGFGIAGNIGYDDGNFSFSYGFGVTEYNNYQGFGTKGVELRNSFKSGYRGKDFGLSVGTNFWNGTGGMSEFKQRTGALGISSGDFNLMYENDGSPFSYAGKLLSNNTDMYRTAAVGISIGDFSLQTNMFTGRSGNDIGQGNNNNNNNTFVDKSSGRIHKKKGNLGLWTNSEADKYRLGALMIGYKGYRIGTNSEYVRDSFQNWFAHKIVSPQPGFKMLTNDWKFYSQHQTSNIFTLW